ncbi:egl9-like protein 2, partial [Moniliophthora roreri MCA 2997]
NAPEWVRATYTTLNENFKLYPDFLGNFHEPEATSTTTKPPIFHIDNVVSQSGYSERSGTSARDKVLGTKEGRPTVSGAWKGRNQRQCSFCKKVGKDKDLQKCSRCKLVFYCGKECQCMAWPSHKIFCKVA